MLKVHHHLWPAPFAFAGVAVGSAGLGLFGAGASAAMSTSSLPAAIAFGNTGLPLKVAALMSPTH